MAEPQPTSGQDALEELTAFVMAEKQAGADRETARIRLLAAGIREEIANELVERIYGAASATQAEILASSSIVPAIIGGILTAIAGGLIWGLITNTTGYEIGWAAWGIGLLAGYGVVMFAKGQGGLRLQLVAALTAVLGIAIGKYLTFFYALKEYVADEYGLEATAELSVLSAGVMQFFADSLGALVTGFDALWMLLAVGTAWGIAKAGAPKLAEASERS
jgi:hypothetical protein